MNMWVSVLYIKYIAANCFEFFCNCSENLLCLWRYVCNRCITNLSIFSLLKKSYLWISVNFITLLKFNEAPAIQKCLLMYIFIDDRHVILLVLSYEFSLLNIFFNKLSKGGVFTVRLYTYFSMFVHRYVFQECSDFDIFALLERSQLHDGPVLKIFLISKW